MNPAYPTLKTNIIGAISLFLFPCAVFATDYTWNSSATATWTASGAWTPSTPSGSAANINIVTPTAFGNLQINGNYEINNFTYTSGSSWVLVANGGNRAFTVDGTLTKSGAGNLTFSNASPTGSQLAANIGAVSVSAGTIFFGVDNSATQLQQITVTGMTTLAGGNIDVNSPNATFGEVHITGGEFNILQGAAGSISSPTVGGVTVGGLSGNGGTVATAWASNRYISGTLTINTATGTSYNYGGQIIDRNGTGGAITLALTKTGQGKQMLSGVNTYTGATTIISGELDVNGSTSGNSVVSVASGAALGGSGTVGGSVSVVGGTLCGSNLVISGSSNFSGNSTISGINTIKTITSIASGTTSLTGTTTATNGLSIGVGATLSNNGLVNGNTTVNGFLKGNGKISGDLSLTSGTLSAGDVYGITTIKGNFTMDSASTLVVEVNGTVAGMSYDQVKVDGTVTLSGILDLTNLAGLTLKDSITLIDNTGADTRTMGYFTTVLTSTGAVTLSGSTFHIGSTAYELNYAANSDNDGVYNDVTLTVVPEPGTWAMMVGGLAFLISARRLRRSEFCAK